jgi:hypothetical protein
MKNYKGNMDSGRSVPRSGIYGFSHAHSAQREIALLKGRFFPFCPICLASRVACRISFRSVPFINARDWGESSLSDPNR